MRRFVNLCLVLAVSTSLFARTFARPHAATRFFPVATTLNAEQLVALHIHEALHRALPESVRENESIVSQLTLALTSPDASHDSVVSAATRLIPVESSLPSDIIAEEEEFEIMRSSVGYWGRMPRSDFQNLISVDLTGAEASTLTAVH